MLCRRIATLPSASLALCAIIPTCLRAQYDQHHPFAVYTGFAFERGSGEFGRGLQIGGHLTLPANAWLGFRLDVGYSYFAGADYIIDYVDGSFSTQRNSLKVLSGTTNVTFLEPATMQRRITWSAGAGLYGVRNAVEGTSHTRVGWNVRMSIPLHNRVAVDLGYHGLIDARSSRGFFPVSLAIGL